MTTPAKIKLGAQPTAFTRPVKFQMLDGSEGAIECKFKYRTRSQFGALVDEMAADSNTEVSDITQAGSMERYMAMGSASNARYLLKILDDWSLDQPLTAETAHQLADELPAAVAAIVEAYRAATIEGRLGN